MSDSIRRNIKKSQAQEHSSMESLGGKVHGGSGNAWSRKGDGRTDGAANSFLDALYEFKRTDKKSITIKSADLEKIAGEAVMEGRRPFLGFELNNRRYVIWEEDDHIELQEFLRDL